MHIVLKGRDADGARRWLCRRCGRTFSRKTMGVLALSKLEPRQWTRFVELFCRHAPLAECARECGVCDKTAHFMRMRLCELVASATPSFRSGPGVSVQIDGWYCNESLSGLGMAGGAQMPRSAHRTGHDVREHGISNMKVCVACGTNSLGDCFLALCDRGRPTDDAVRAAVSGRVSEGTVASTDEHQAYAHVLPAMLGAAGAHLVFPSDGSAGAGLGDVGALQKRLQDFLGPMNGVSTRWLGHYLMWFRWEEHVRRSGADRERALTDALSSGAYRSTRRSPCSVGRPFWGYWEGKAPVVDPVGEWGGRAA